MGPQGICSKVFFISIGINFPVVYHTACIVDLFIKINFSEIKLFKSISWKITMFWKRFELTNTFSWVPLSTNFLLNSTTPLESERSNEWTWTFWKKKKKYYKGGLGLLWSETVNFYIVSWSFFNFCLSFLGWFFVTTYKVNCSSSFSNVQCNTFSNSTIAACYHVWLFWTVNIQVKVSWVKMFTSRLISSPVI